MERIEIMKKMERFLCALLVVLTMTTLLSEPVWVQAATASGNQGEEIYEYTL